MKQILLYNCIEIMIEIKSVLTFILELLPPFAKIIDIESIRRNNQSYLSINMNKS